MVGRVRRFQKARSVQKGAHQDGCGTCGFHGVGRQHTPQLLTLPFLPEHGGGVGKGQPEREIR